MNRVRNVVAGGVILGAIAAVGVIEASRVDCYIRQGGLFDTNEVLVEPEPDVPFFESEHAGAECLPTPCLTDGGVTTARCVRRPTARELAQSRQPEVMP